MAGQRLSGAVILCVGEAEISHILTGWAQVAMLARLEGRTLPAIVARRRDSSRSLRSSSVPKRPRSPNTFAGIVPTAPRTALSRDWFV